MDNYNNYKVAGFMTTDEQKGNNKPDYRILWEVLGLEQTREIKVMKRFDGSKEFRDLVPEAKITNFLHFKASNGQTVALEINEKDLERVMPQRNAPPPPDKTLETKVEVEEDDGYGVTPEVVVTSAVSALPYLDSFLEDHRNETTAVEFLACDGSDCFGVLAVTMPRDNWPFGKEEFKEKALWVRWGFPEYHGKIPEVASVSCKLAGDILAWVKEEEKDNQGVVYRSDDPKHREIGFISLRNPDAIQRRCISLTAIKTGVAATGEELLQLRKDRVEKPMPEADAKILATYLGKSTTSQVN